MSTNIVTFATMTNTLVSSKTLCAAHFTDITIRAFITIFLKAFFDILEHILYLYIFDEYRIPIYINDILCHII